VDESASSDNGKVPLYLRVGISGHRNITRTYPGLDDVARYVRDVITTAQDAIAAESAPVCVRVVSALAEGTDRILIPAIMPADGQPQGTGYLEAILPLDQAEYCTDFGSAASKQEFSDLLAGAVVREVVPAAASRELAYQSAGRAVVDRSDVMVFVWNGEPKRGLGGTAEIFEYARERNKRIFWIRTGDGRAELALEPWARKSWPRVTPLSRSALRGLDRYNREALPPPSPSSADDPPLLGKLGEKGLESAAELSDYFSPYYARADALAGRFQHRWFWLTRLLYGLAALAVAIVATQVLYEPHHERYAWFEFATLICVMVLLLLAHFSSWHDRWISARYIAEQIRSLAFLGLVGASGSDDMASTNRPSHSAEAGSWTNRAVEEIWWSRPPYTPGDVEATRKFLDEQWICDQLIYHENTSAKYETKSRRFTWAAVCLFTLSAVAALLHSAGVGGPNEFWAFLSILVPAVGAALSGYAAQRDYARHAERSKLFAVTLDQARKQLVKATSLHDMQQVALSVAILMRGEASDWYSIVRMQEIEPP
jgi:hypothetical protein